jgi:hypothetical protein
MGSFAFLSPEQLALQQQQEIHQLQASANAANSSNMLAMASSNNAAMLAANQQRMQQMQMEMVRGQQLIAQQLDMRRSETRMALSSVFALPGAAVGTSGFGGRNIGVAPNGLYQQSFGGILADAGLSKGLNIATGGIFFKDWATQYGASRLQTAQMAQSELQQRFAWDGDVMNSWRQNWFGGTWASTPDNFLGLGHIDRYKNLKGDFARGLQARMSHFRGADTANGSGLADGVGVDLRSDIVQTAKQRIFERANILNSRLGNSISDKNMGMMAEAAITAVDDRVLRTAARMKDQKEGGALIGEEAGSILIGMKKLADALQMNEKAVSALVVENKRAGFNFAHLQASGSFISKMQTSSAMGADELAQQYIAYSVQGRSMGYGDGSAYAKTQFGLNQRLEENMKNNPDLLYMYGGSNDTDAAMNYRNAMSGFGANVQQRFGRSLGILAMNQNNPGADGSGFMGMASVGAALGRNPYAGLQAEQSAIGSRRMGQNGREIMFNQISRLEDMNVFGSNLAGADAMAVKMYANAMGMTNQVAARQDYLQQKSDRRGIRDALKTAGLTGSDKEARDLEAMNQLANEAGAPLTDMTKAEQAEMYRKWVASGRKEGVDDFRSIVPGRVEKAWSDKEMTRDMMVDSTFTSDDSDNGTSMRGWSSDPDPNRAGASGIQKYLTPDDFSGAIRGAYSKADASKEWDIWDGFMWTGSDNDSAARSRERIDKLKADKQKQLTQDILRISNEDGRGVSEELAIRMAKGDRFTAEEANQTSTRGGISGVEWSKIRQSTSNLIESLEDQSKRNADSKVAVTIADFSDRGLNRFVSELKRGS